MNCEARCILPSRGEWPDFDKSSLGYRRVFLTSFVQWLRKEGHGVSKQELRRITMTHTGQVQYRLAWFIVPEAKSFHSSWIHASALPFVPGLNALASGKMDRQKRRKPIEWQIDESTFRVSRCLIKHFSAKVIGFRYWYSTSGFIVARFARFTIGVYERYGQPWSLGDGRVCGSF